MTTDRCMSEMWACMAYGLVILCGAVTGAASPSTLYAIGLIGYGGHAVTLLAASLVPGPFHPQSLESRLINRALFWVSGWLPFRRIDRYDGERYLERYHVGALFGWRVYLHRFVGGDTGETVHNHPWPLALSIVLAGGYLEERNGAERDVSLGNVITRNTRHRIVTAFPGTWTLFLHRDKRVQRWGFEQDEVIVPYEGSPGHGWWLESPRGRDADRAPL